MTRYLIISLFLLLAVMIDAQPLNDDCFTPIELSAPLGLTCSEVGAYTNVSATLSPMPPDPMCWPNNPNTADVWFSFQASGTALTITLIGNTEFMSGGSLSAPMLAVYSGVCGGLTEVSCKTDAFGSNSIELVQTELVVGERYYIRVSAAAARQGSFQFCLSAFNLVPPPESDCVDAVLLCDKASFNVENLAGVGSVINEFSGQGLCLESEMASSWYKWVADQSGTLTFTLTPNNPEDDLDFILFELPGGLDDCANKQGIRCMASGANIDQPPGNWVRCTGPTGLRQGDPDLVELSGCQENSNNNFLRELDMVSGTAYVLMINNFSESGQGFTMDFGGTGTFLGPEASINIIDGQTLDSIECDKTFTLQESINFPTGTVDQLEWRFGANAVPLTATGPGPHNVNFTSIGFKTITLSITTDRGCIYNEILELDVLPCCDDVIGYDIALDSTSDLQCFGIPTGAIAVSGIGGNPFYEYSLNGMDWQFNDIFTGLNTGDYDIFIRDRKGCIDSITTSISAPPELLVDVGADVTIGLGCNIEVIANVFPPGTNVTYSWSSSDTSFDDPGTPEFTTFPPGTTSYELTVTDVVGCTAIDEKLVISDDNRPVFIPNAFSPNNDGINDYFAVFTNKATRQISSIKVFDQWGSKVFERDNISANIVTDGWDGTFNGEVLNPGVYAYVVEVLFVDGITEIFHGDVTLLK